VLSYTVVIETENLANGDLSDLEACLDSIRAQHVSMPPAALLVINSGQVAATILDEVVRRYDSLTVHTSPTSLHYYDAKLAGARLASTDIVVFADSDLRYEQGWLAALLAPFAEPDVDFVTGETRVAITGPYTFSVATTWLFPRRYDAGPAPSLIANNCAVRREALLAHPFPQELPLYRTSITLHGRQLRQRDITIRRVPALGWHAPPHGAREWALRYLVSGADSVLAGTWDVGAGGALRRVDTTGRRARAWATSVARKLLSSVVRTQQAWAERPFTLFYAPVSLPLSLLALALFAGGGFSAVCGSRAAHERMHAFEVGAGGVR
jgi:hypothetical protein